MLGEIGLNMTVLNNLPELNISLPAAGADVIDTVVTTTHAATNGYIAYFILFVSAFILYYVLSDKTPFADFNYDDGRALVIAFGITATLMITLVEINWIQSFRAVGLNIAMYVCSWIFVAIYESKGESE